MGKEDEWIAMRMRTGRMMMRTMRRRMMGVADEEDDGSGGDEGLGDLEREAVRPLPLLPQETKKRS
eukprot:281978-Pyramimonas_sp.AAC.1